MERLRGVGWVSYIEAAPSSDARADQVLKYQARYLTGGPISDRRIVWADGSEVTFLAREGVQPGGDRKQVPITLSVVEFVRRWCLHILPKGFTKVRFCEGWSPRRRSEYLERCCHMLERSDAPPGADALESALRD